MEKKSKGKKKVVVFFSGGLDSTFLVWKNLTEGNIVYPVYVEIGNNKNKSILEKNRTKLLWDLFKKEFKCDDYYQSAVNNIFTITVDANESSLYFKQMPIWILGAIYAQGFDADEIQIGYVMNDDAISYLKDIKNIYRSYQPICETLIPLKFPLSKKAKFQMMSELPKKYRDLIISCENPHIVDGDQKNDLIEYEPRCECVPCSHIIGSDFYGGNYPENYKNNLIIKKKQDILSLGGDIYTKDGKSLASWELRELVYQQPPIDYPPNGQYELNIEYDVEPNNYDEPTDEPKDEKN